LQGKNNFCDKVTKLIDTEGLGKLYTLEKIYKKFSLPVKKLQANQIENFAIYPVA